MMITPKELRANINQLSQISDLILQKERQVDFWRTQARNQMRKNNKLRKEIVISKSDILFDDLNERHYFTDSDGVCWQIFNDNMYTINDVNEYVLVCVPGKDGHNIGVLMPG